VPGEGTQILDVAPVVLATSNAPNGTMPTRITGQPQWADRYAPVKGPGTGRTVSTSPGARAVAESFSVLRTLSEMRL
jgi:hypothetical protein